MINELLKLREYVHSLPDIIQVLIGVLIAAFSFTITIAVHFFIKEIWD